MRALGAMNDVVKLRNALTLIPRARVEFTNVVGPMRMKSESVRLILKFVWLEKLMLAPEVRFSIVIPAGNDVSLIVVPKLSLI